MADLSTLPQTSLSDRGLTAHLASRFHQGIPFSTISTRTLIALNTYTNELDVNQQQVFQDLASRIENRLSLRMESQSCIFLGESGSGKTEFANSLVSSLLVLANNPLSSKIGNVQPVLEAFGTAKTSSSLKASKVGLVREFQYDSESNLIGAAIYDFRLERQRVTKVNTNERNYQVFYNMINGLSSQERRHLQLENPSFRYLGHISQVHLSGVDDRMKFKQLKLALYSLGFSRADVANIFQILAAILHLGELNFRDTNHDASISATAAVEITNTEVLDVIAMFLGVPPDLLATSIIAKTVTVNNDRFTVVLDQRGAREQADSLARALYTMVFSYIMDRINQQLALEPDSPDVAATISVCDFPGFQPSQSRANASQVPQLDRLLHNCANEMWYNYFVHVYFRAPQDVLESEDVECPPMEFFDNAVTVRTLAKPTSGVIAVLNDYAKRDRDAISLEDSLSRRFPNSTALQVSGNQFSVNHFAGEASYSIPGLLAAAKETISTDVISLFVQSTTNDFLHSVFENSVVIDSTQDDTAVQAHVANEPRRQISVRREAESFNVPKFGSVRRSGTVRQDQRGRQHQRRSSNPIKPRGRTLNSKKEGPSGLLSYITSLDETIDSMDSTNPYFVLCLKPNDSRLVSSLDARCVRQQVSALGLPEVAKRMAKMDLSIFMPFSEFLRNSFSEDLIDHEQTERDACLSVISSKQWPARDAALGLTGVFLSENAWLSLVDPNLHFVDVAAEKFSAYRGNLYDAQYNSELESKNLVGGFGNMFSYVPKSKSAAIEDSNIPSDAVDYTAPPHESAERRTWLFLVWMYTWWYPTAFIRGTFASVKLAWREKLAINMIIWGICASSMIILVGLPYFICPLQNILSEGQLQEYSYASNPDKVYTAIHGTVYDITKFASTHFPSIVPQQNILKYGGKDASDLFPLPVSALCSFVSSDQIVIGDPNNYTDPNAVYHDFRGTKEDYRPDWYAYHMNYFNHHYLKSFLGYTPDDILSMVDKKSLAVFSLHGYVYDLTDYLTNNIYDASQSGENTNFLPDSLVSLVQSNLGRDITKKFKQLKMSTSDEFETTRCLRNLFMKGKVDTQNSARCLFARYLLLGITCFVVLVIAAKFIAALQFGGYEYPDEIDKFVICQVPVYTEDEGQLRRAIDSLTRTKYDDKRKLLVVICDGMIVGAGNEKPTPRIVLDIFGHPPDVDPPALAFESLGEGDQQLNYGKIYTGLYEDGGHIVPYMVIVKVGKTTEVFRPGNRGKRDSQLLLMRFFNRVHYESPMNPLELEMYHQIQNVIGIKPSYYEFLMQVDADTEVSRESLSQLMGKMVRDTKIQAICGETELSNSRESLTTMIQVYEYYISHNLAKAFESLFGTVTCLPGCFSLYRLFEEDGGKPLLVSHPVLDAYSENTVRTLHMKNLLQLGEDRYLSTLLLKYNPRFSTKFLRHAHAYTVAPDSWQVLFSQRRRWINSTVHNMVELTPLGQMCGFCCFSMRFMVLIDLLSTCMQPVTLGYIIYLIYLCATRGGTVPWSSIALICAVYGLQIIIFVLRLKWEMIGWMFVYILALPIHSLILPLYSFWFMDDFSWGNTRMVVGEKGKKVLINDEGHFDLSEIPRKLWKDYEAEKWSAQNLDDQVLRSRRDSDTNSLAPTVQMARENPFRESAMPRTPDMSSYSLGLDDEKQPLTAMPTDSELTEGIREIIARSDIDKITKRTIRKELEDMYNCNLSGRKEYLSWVIEAVFKGEI